MTNATRKALTEICALMLQAGWDHDKLKSQLEELATKPEEERILYGYSLDSNDAYELAYKDGQENIRSQLRKILQSNYGDADVPGITTE